MKKDDPRLIPATIFFLALIYRLLYVIPINVELTSDMKGYADCARNYLGGEGLIMSEEYRAYRPPLYPLFLAASFAVFGERYTPVRLVQAFVGALAAVLVFFLTLRLFEPGSGRPPDSIRDALANPAWLAASLAAVGAAIFDSLVFYCGEFLTETWYVFLLLALVHHLASGSFGPGRGVKLQLRAAVLSGGLLGLLALLRPAALFLTPAVLIVERKRGGTFRSLFFTVTAAAVAIFPWTLRNAATLGSFVPISTNTGVNLYIGHNPYFGYWSTGNKEGIRQETDLNEVAESRYFTRLAVEYAVSHPWRTLRNTMAKFYNLYRLPWTPSFLVRSEEDRVRSYKPWPWPGNGATLRFAVVKWLPTIEWGIPFMLFSLLGLGLSFRDRSKFLLFYLVILCHTLAYLVFFGRTRFAVTMMPLFCIFAAYGLVRVLVWSKIVRFSTDQTDKTDGGEKNRGAENEARKSAS